MDDTALAVVAVGLAGFALLVVLAVAVRVGRLLRRPECHGFISTHFSLRHNEPPPARIPDRSGCGG